MVTSDHHRLQFPAESFSLKRRLKFPYLFWYKSFALVQIPSGGQPRFPHFVFVKKHFWDETGRRRRQTCRTVALQREQTRYKLASHGQILALPFKEKCSKPVQLSPLRSKRVKLSSLRSEAGGTRRRHRQTWRRRLTFKSLQGHFAHKKHPSAKTLQ